VAETPALNKANKAILRRMVIRCFMTGPEDLHCHKWVEIWLLSGHDFRTARRENEDDAPTRILLFAVHGKTMTSPFMPSWS
jgi:hypothetical protein